MGLDQLVDEHGLMDISAVIREQAEAAPPSERLGCLRVGPLASTAYLREQARAASAMARAHPSAMASASRAIGRYKLGLARDAQLARMRGLGGDYTACVCGGAGGRGGRLAVTMAPLGVPLAVQTADGTAVLTWAEVCPCPEGQTHALAVAQARAEAIERYRHDRAARLAKAGGIADVGGWTLATWAAAAAEAGAAPGVVAQVRETIHTWRKTHQPSVLRLAGNPGTGKSVLAAVLALDWIRAGGTATAVGAAALASGLLLAPWEHDPDGQRAGKAELLARYQEAGLLVLDDLGTEGYPHAWGSQWLAYLFGILEARILANRPTIVTTNLTWRELAELYGLRVQERLTTAVCAATAVLDVPSLRTHGRPGGQGAPSEVS